ncbi:MAG: T9SS type A sorting domain-containing protein [Dysgonomonas sp.]
MKISILKKFLLGTGLVVSASLTAQVEYPAFTEITPSGTPGLFRGNAIWCDYNNDGFMDAFVVGRDTKAWTPAVFVLKNENGNLVRVDETVFPSSGVYNAIFACLDYDNDGNIDLLYMGTTNGETSENSTDMFIHLYKNTGAEGGYSFELVDSETGLNPLYVEQEGNYASVISTGDYDNDGYTDIIMTGKRDGGRYVELYKNNGGNGTFTLQTTPDEGAVAFHGVSGGSVAFADMNKDGLLDVIYNGWSDITNDGLTKLYINKGDGTFYDNSIEIDIYANTMKGQIGVNDLNGDGNLDLLITGERYEGGTWPRVTDLYLFKEFDGEFLFYTEVDSDDAGIDKMKNSSVDFADVNADGKLDIIMAGQSNTAHTSMYINNGDGTYSFKHDLLGAYRSGAIVTMADFNNDGYLDAISMGYNNDLGAYTGIYKNNGNLTANTDPKAPTNLQKTYADGKVTFTWDAGSDLETPTAALRYNLYIKKNNGEIFTLVPANPNTGFLKVSEYAVAPAKTSYTMKMQDGDFEWGVQTIDQGKRGSAFAKYGTNSIESSLKDLNANVYVSDGKIGVVLNGESAEITIFDVKGRMLSKEVRSVDGLLNVNLDKSVYVVKIQTATKSKISKILL